MLTFAKKAKMGNKKETGKRKAKKREVKKRKAKKEIKKKEKEEVYLEERFMNENFAILGMFDRNSIMSVINKQPSTYKFIVAAVNSGVKTDKIFQEEDMLSKEKEILNNLGIRCNLLGYNYILDALRRIKETPDSLKNITKELYPELAGQYKTQPCNIERAIRHAIEHAWNIGNVELKNRIFGYTISPEKGRPSNGEFLAAVAHYLNY